MQGCVPFLSPGGEKMTETLPFPGVISNSGSSAHSSLENNFTLRFHDVPGTSKGTELVAATMGISGAAVQH